MPAISTVTIAQTTMAAMPRVDGFIAQALCPRVPLIAPNKLGEVTYQGIAYREPQDLVRRGPSGRSLVKVQGRLPESFGYSLESYQANATMRTFDCPIDYDEVESLPFYGLQRWAEQNVPERSARIALIDQETRFSDLLVSGNFGTNLDLAADNIPQLNVSSSDPIKDVFLPMLSGIRNKGGDLEDGQELVVGMTSAVFDALVNNPAFQRHLGDGEDALSVRGVSGILKAALLGRYPGTAQLGFVLRVATATGSNANEGDQVDGTAANGSFIAGNKIVMAVRAKPSVRAIGDLIAALKEEGPTSAEMLAEATTDLMKRTWARKYVAKDVVMKHIEDDNLEIHRFRFKEASDLSVFSTGLGALAVNVLAS